MIDEPVSVAPNLWPSISCSRAPLVHNIQYPMHVQPRAVHGDFSTEWPSKANNGGPESAAQGLWPGTSDMTCPQKRARLQWPDILRTSYSTKR